MDNPSAPGNSSMEGSAPLEQIPTATADYAGNVPTIRLTNTQTNPITPIVSNSLRPSISAVRVRRLPSSSVLPRVQEGVATGSGGVGETRRRRSESAPQPPQHAHADLRREHTVENLPPLTEERSGPSAAQTQDQSLAPPPPTRLRAGSSPTRFLPSRGGSRARSSSAAQSSRPPGQEYEPEIVDLLDVIDPEVSTLNTLNNVQNSLFIPYLGRYFNRQQTYDLSPASSPDDSSTDLAETKPDDVEKKPTADVDIEQAAETIADNQLTQSHTLSSVLSTTEEGEGHNYAVLPHNTVLEGWSEEDKAILNDYVRHLLHSRRAAFKRRMKAFGKFVKKPVGFLITLYSFLLFFWGLAWTLFLIGWIYVGDRQKYFIEICDQILTALFCVVGIGMAPFRAVDTYHMIYIAHYHFLTWRLRREQSLPDLTDPNELPERHADADVELARSKAMETVMLTPEQQKKLIHHQDKFSRSHTFYKPHETFTHYAFSVKLLIAIVVILDCHSLFQMALGGTTWGIYYRVRPKALTAAILTCSITCNITGGVLISIGDRLSRKKQIVTQIFRQTLTQEAMEKLERERGLSHKTRKDKKVVSTNEDDKVESEEKFADEKGVEVSEASNAAEATPAQK